MERMLVVVFTNESKAYEGQAALRQLENEGSITTNRTVVVAKEANGMTSIKQYDDVSPSGPFVGTSFGGPIALLVGPLGGAYRPREEASAKSRCKRLRHASW